MVWLRQDDFNRADVNPLAGVWSTALPEGVALQIVSNSARASTISTDCAAYYNAVSLPADQWAQCTLGAVAAGTDGAGPAVRFNRTAFTCYGLQAGDTQLTLCKFVAGVFTSLDSSGAACVSGDTLRLEARGSTLTIVKNGVVTLRINDTSLTTGDAAGLIAFTNTGGLGLLDNFEAGDFNYNVGGIVVAPSQNVSTAPQVAGY